MNEIIMNDITEQFILPACNTCKHYNIGSDPPSCLAFREIPEDILKGMNDHTFPAGGDHGVMWEKDNG